MTVDFAPGTGRRPFAPEIVPPSLPEETASPDMAETEQEVVAPVSPVDMDDALHAAPGALRKAPIVGARTSSHARRSGLRLPIALACLVALAIVGASLFFQSRPDADPIAPPKNADTAAPPGQTSEEITATEAADGAPDNAALTPAPAPVEPAATAPEAVAPVTGSAPAAPATDAIPLAENPATIAAPATPDPVDEFSPPGTPRAPVIRPMPRPTRQAASAASVIPVAADMATVVIRVGPDMEPERQAQIVAALSEAGYASVEVQSVTFNVARSRLGFFRNEDRQIAEALAALIFPLAGNVAVRNYDQLLAEPAPGRLDLWLRS